MGCNSCSTSCLPGLDTIRSQKRSIGASPTFRAYSPKTTEMSIFCHMRLMGGMVHAGEDQTPSGARLCRRLQTHTVPCNCQGRQLDIRSRHLPVSKRHWVDVGPQVNLRRDYVHTESKHGARRLSLLDLLRQGRIWAVNLGETDFSQEQWWGLWTCCQKRQSLSCTSEQHTSTRGRKRSGTWR
jgi:hypothetical protein